MRSMRNMKTCLLRFHPNREMSSFHTVSLFTCYIGENRQAIFVSIYSFISIILISCSYLYSEFIVLGSKLAIEIQ